MKEEKSLSEIFGEVCALFLGVIALSFLGGWSLKCYWEWFLMPAFAIEQISYKVAVGLYFFISVMKLSYKKTEKTKASEAFAMSVAMWAIFFFIGWLIHVFIR